MSQPRHGIDGWQLEHMEWCPETGVATLQYSRETKGRPTEEVQVEMLQPTCPQHVGWQHLS